MTELIQQTDFQILDWIQANLRTPWLDWLMPKITFLCESGWFWIVLTIVLLIWKRHRKCGWGMFTALILSLLIGNLLLKHAVARPRPCWIIQILICWSRSRKTFPSRRGIQWPALPRPQSL